jgi:hypothetical protein
MNKFKKYLIGLLCVVMGCVCTACSNDDLDTNQYKGGVSLSAFGPSPVMRGSEIRFLGCGLDQVTSVVIPGCGEITNIKVVSENEIRVTIPQEADPGYITLKSPKGDIVTKTQISFTDPIEIKSIDQEGPIKPGKQLTIKGDKLYDVKAVIFADGVYVTDTAFVKKTREELVVTVPRKAQTGEIILSDTTPADEEDGTIPNYIYSGQEVEITLPSAVTSIDLTSVIPGSIVEINGTDLDLVQKIEMPTGDEVEFDYVNDGTTESLIFTLPTNVCDGAIVVIPESGVRVAIANMGVAMPSELTATPSEDIEEKTPITIKGINLDLVTSINFPGVSDEVKIESQSATEIKVTAPKGTITGDIQLHTASGQDATVAIKTRKPEFIAFASDEVSLGANVVIQGKNLDLVSSVIFTGDAEVTVKPTSSTELTITAPATGAQSGKLTLMMANGESVETESITLTIPNYCYAAELPGTDDEIKAGSAVTLTVANSDELTDVQVNGKSVQYVLTNDGQLIIRVPDNAKKGAQFTLVSGENSISYTIDCTPATEVTTTLWEDLVDLGSWSINYEVKPNDMFVNKDLKVGDKVRIYGTNTADWWQIQLYTGLWSGFSMAEYGGGNNINTDTSTTYASEGYIEFTVDETLVTALQTDIDWGYAFIIQGESFVISKIVLFQENPAEEELWTGTVDLGSWSINWEMPADLFSSTVGTVKAGQILRIYGTPTADYWQVQLFDGHWGGMTSLGDTFGNGNNVNSDICDLADGCIAINVTAEMAELYNTLTDYGYCGIIQGESFIVTKITIE